MSELGAYLAWQKERGLVFAHPVEAPIAEEVVEAPSSPVLQEVEEVASIIPKVVAQKIPEAYLVGLGSLSLEAEELLRKLLQAIKISFDECLQLQSAKNAADKDGLVLVFNEPENAPNITKMSKKTLIVLPHPQKLHEFPQLKRPAWDCLKKILPQN